MESYKDETIRQWADNVYQKICKKIEAQTQRVGTNIPYIPENGRYKDMGEVGIHWWTNGFWPGILWQMFHATGNKLYLDTARGVEKRLDRALNHYSGLDHDVMRLTSCQTNIDGIVVFKNYLQKYLLKNFLQLSVFDKLLILQ